MTTTHDAAETALYDKYSHAQRLVMKALVNRGGSTSETIVYKFLTSDSLLFSTSDSVTEMWDYLDNNTKSAMLEYANIAWHGPYIADCSSFMPALQQRMIRMRQNQLFTIMSDNEPNRYRNDDDGELYNADDHRCYQLASTEIELLFK